MRKIFQRLIIFICIVIPLSQIFGQDIKGKIVKFDAIMDEFVKPDQFSGCVLIAKNGKPFYAKAFGEADKDFHAKNTLDTKFNIGSIGKTFTSVAIMQLAQAGKLDVNDPVVKYLKDFPFGDRITIHHLLTHTSGLFNYFAHPDFQMQIHRIRSVKDALPLIYDQKLRFDTPGEQYFYSNSGIVVLGAVIEAITGQPYPEYITEHILAPLQMNDTGIHFPDQVVENRAVGYMRSITGRYKRNVLVVPPANADGGIETTVGDLLKFDQALYNDMLLNASFREIMFTPFLNDYGYCWRIEPKYGHRVIGHSGGAPGVNARFSRYVDDGYTLIVLSNYSEAANRIGNALEAILLDQDFQRPGPDLRETLITSARSHGLAYTIENIEKIIQENQFQIPMSGLLNNLGYELLGEDEIDMAIKVFKLNVDRFPGEPNPYDSLGEAFVRKGDSASAITWYQKALEIDPNFPSAKEALDKLMKK